MSFHLRLASLSLASLSLLACSSGPSTSTGSDVAPPGALPTRAQLDPWLQPLLDGHFVHGMVIGVVDASGSAVYGYGAVGDTGAAPTGDTIFPIGSVTKTFTGLLLASQIQAGQLHLNDPVQPLLPAGVTVPSYQGAPITLQDLTTHTSGLPGGAPASYQPTDPANFWGSFTVADLYAMLSSTTLTAAPGTQYAYSNIGEGLLGLALSLQAGSSWNDDVQRVIAGPLGLHDTTNTLSAAQAARRAPGYDGDLDPAEAWTFTEAIAGAGSLQSTANDLLAYAAAEAGLTSTPLDAAMVASQVPLHATDNAGFQIGFNWIIVSQPNIVWHNGAVGDGVAFVGFDPKTHVGAVVLIDTAAWGVGTPIFSDLPTSIGVMLVHEMQDGSYTPPALSTLLPAVVPVDAAQLQAYAGTYDVPGASAPLVITVQGDRLEASASWVFWRPVGLYPTSATTFLCRSTAGAATFAVAADGTTTVTLTAGGQTVSGKKQ